MVNLRNLKLYQSFFLQSQCYANENKLQAKTLKKKQKHTNMRKLNKMLLNNHWITEEIKEEIKKKYLDTSENESTKIQNLWSAAKAVLRGKFRAM